MLKFSKTDEKINVPQIIDEIEKAVYAHLKPNGFKKYGRTLHRFVSQDISQVINFQSGMSITNMYGLFCVNVGIRIPECSEREFSVQSKKKYYHEYECTIRSRLGIVSGKRETWYDLYKPTEKITKSIINEIDEVVLPVFEVLNSRENILAHRKDYPLFDSFSSISLLEESMIYGHLGKIEKARELFELYYKDAVDEYEDKCKNGQRYFLKKGQRMVSMGQDITAEKDGYVTFYGASHAHIDYLDELAVKLGLR